MGIQGLLPFLKAIHQPVNIADFSGCTVAIDAYCWLHKGAFSCAEKLALGEKTDQYVYYCMKYVEYMLRKNLKPILVFDGCHLKSKADVEKTRRERRELHRKKAAQFLREGKRNEAKECLQRCVDITPQMALELMNACRDRGVDCIVAPYEADAQLAYLNLRGIADIVVTEDSDLLLFGCEKIIFKMDFFGNGTLIEKFRLNEVLSINGGFYTFEKFRHMCILSGCDYLSSLPGIGLARACKVMKTARQPDLRQMLKKLPTYLKANLTVTDEYIEGFIRADNTFLYQLIFDPISRKLCPLNPYPPEVDGSSMDYAGEYIQDEKAFQIALGNLDVHTYKCISYFDPDTFLPKNAVRPKFRHQLSIWDKNYCIKSKSPCKEVSQPLEDKERPSLHDKEQAITVKSIRRISVKQHKVNDVSDMMTNKELVCLYGNDNENTNPDFHRASRSVSKSEVTSSLTKSQVDKTTDSFTLGTPEKTQTTSLSRKENNEELQDSSKNESTNGESSSREEEKPICRKRKMSTTPSKPSAANIGEDAFKETSINFQVNSGSTPDKGRNIFAVSASAAKVPKFDLDTLAVQVRSRYFQNSSSMKSLKKDANPVKKNLTPSPAKSADSNPKGQKSIRLLFENAPVHSEPEKHCRPEPKPSPQKGIFKYFCSPESQSVKKSINALPQMSSAEDDVVSNKSSQEHPQQPVSVYEKFRSNFKQSSSKQNTSRLGCAFNWSNSRNGLQSLASVIPKSIYHEKVIKLEPNNPDDSQTAPKDTSQSCSQRLFKNIDNAETSVCGSETETVKPYPPVSSLFRQDQPESKDNFPGTAADARNCQVTNQFGDVTELQSYSYNDFVKSLTDGDQPHKTENDGEASNSQTFERASSQAQSMFDSIGESPSQTISADSGFSDSATILSLGEEKASPGNSCQRNISCSLHTGSVPIKEDFVDLTNTNADSQSSSPSRLSGSSVSSQNNKCRISGLSKKSKGRSSLKKSNSSIPGQRSIKDLMSKFQYKGNNISTCVVDTC